MSVTRYIENDMRKINIYGKVVQKSKETGMPASLPSVSYDPRRLIWRANANSMPSRRLGCRRRDRLLAAAGWGFEPAAKRHPANGIAAE